MATKDQTANVISAAIQILDQQRKPLLKTMRAKGFSQTTPEHWATVYHLMGLNVMLHQLEAARTRYLIIAQEAAAKNEEHEHPSPAEIDQIVEDLLRNCADGQDLT